MKKSNIALIGFMGTGKTVIGKKVAEKLGKKFIEMDDLIVKKAGKSIPRIFKENGEIYFRELEIQVCKEVSKLENIVISCGGGVVINKINLDYLNQSSIIICLNASPEVIYERIIKEGKQKRPLLDNPDPLKTIIEILEFRNPLYRHATKYHIDTSYLSIDQVVDEVINIYKKAISENT